MTECFGGVCLPWLSQNSNIFLFCWLCCVSILLSVLQQLFCYTLWKFTLHMPHQSWTRAVQTSKSSFCSFFFSFLPHQFKLRKQHRILISAFSTKWKHFVLLALHFPLECDSRQKARENVNLTLHFSLLSRTAVLHWLLFNIWKEYLLYIVFYNCLRWRDSLI